MIHPLNQVAGALVGDVGPSLALVQGKPDSPFGDILGYVIVFFVVVWPIIRGLLGNANEKRKKHEEQQRQTGGRAAASQAQGRSRLDAFIEEMVSGQRARHDAPDEDADLSATAVVQEAPPPRRPRPQPARPVVPRPVTPRTVVPRTVAPPAASPFRPSSLSEYGPGPGLTGDPFDDSAMGRPLVQDSILSKARSENEVEDSVSYEQTIDRKALSVAQGDTVVTGDAKVDGLERIHRGRTRWQAAFVLKEVLGPPGGLRSSSDPYR